MTCDDFYRLTNADPQRCTASELAAVAVHAHQCPPCWRRLRAAVRAGREAGFRPTPECDRVVAESVERCARRAAVDPELASVLGRLRYGGGLEE
jgi:hypothetical protein